MSMQNTATPVAPFVTSPRLLDQVRALALIRFGRPEPGDRYAAWALRFIVFHGKRHPRDLGRAEIGQYLEHLANSEKDPLRALEQAREALTFLYEQVLRVEMSGLPYPEPPKLLVSCPGWMRFGQSGRSVYRPC